jgi:hypothetical protein
MLLLDVVYHLGVVEGQQVARAIPLMMCYHGSWTRSDTILMRCFWLEVEEDKPLPSRSQA